MTIKIKLKEIRVSTYYLFSAIVFFLLSPLPGVEFSWLGVSLILFLILRNQGRIAEVEVFKEFALIVIYSLVTVLVAFVLGMFALTQVSYLKLILVGLLVDGVNSAMSIVFPIPIISDLVVGALVGAIMLTFFTGSTGFFLTYLMIFIAFIPGPSLGLHTASLVFLKVLASALGG